MHTNYYNYFLRQYFANSIIFAQWNNITSYVIYWIIAQPYSTDIWKVSTWCNYYGIYLFKVHVHCTIHILYNHTTLVSSMFCLSLSIFILMWKCMVSLILFLRYHPNLCFFHFDTSKCSFIFLNVFHI